MPRPTCKSDLLEASQVNFAKLWDLLEYVEAENITTRLDFSDGPKRKEAHWARDKDVKDVLIHLYEWHQLLIAFVMNNQAGQAQPFLPEPYNWRTYGEMNISFVKKHEKTTLEEAKCLLQDSHGRALQLVESFSNEELFTKNIFGWTGNNTLGSYFVSSMSSHYEWAIKKLNAHIKNLYS